MGLFGPSSEASLNFTSNFKPLLASTIARNNIQINLLHIISLNPFSDRVGFSFHNIPYLLK